MRDRIVVTGGGGFIGPPTVRALLRGDNEVVVYDSFVTGHRDRLPEHPDLHVIEGDIRDDGALGTALSGATVVVHLAAKHFIPWCLANPAETLEVNVVGFQRVLDAAAGRGVERIVFASTADVYVPSSRPHTERSATGPGNVYGTSKLFGEALLHEWRRQHGSSIAVARLFNVYGPGETNPHVLPEIMDHLRRGDDLPLGNTHPRRDYIYVDDVAEALCALAAFPSEELIVNVGSGNAVSVCDLVEQLRSLTGRPLRILTHPDRVRISDRPHLQADITKLRSLYPHLVARPLNLGLAELLAHEGLYTPGSTAGRAGDA